jgi:hypothetical protein
MAYRIAGIDVHKKRLAVVVSDVEGEGEYQFERRTVGTSPDQLRVLAAWLTEREVEEVMNEGSCYRESIGFGRRESIACSSLRSASPSFGLASHRDHAARRPEQDVGPASGEERACTPRTLEAKNRQLARVDPRECREVPGTVTNDAGTSSARQAASPGSRRSATVSSTNGWSARL